MSKVNKGKRQNITKDKIIKMAAEVTGKDVDTVKTCYHAVEIIVKDYIASTELNNPLSIRICEGINIDCTYIPPKQKKNNLTGEVINVAGHIKPKFNITRSYINSLNNSSKK